VTLRTRRCGLLDPEAKAFAIL